MNRRFDSGLMRRLLEGGKLTRVPCAYDGFSARVAQQLGFPVIGFTGNAVSGSLLGIPDVGALGMWENVAHCGKIARSLNVPVLCDADTGYGGIMNVVRTVREFEAAGIAAIHIEDQVTPKRCGLLPQGIPVISREENAAKVKAACDARSSKDFLIIARTDAKSKHEAGGCRRACPCLHRGRRGRSSGGRRQHAGRAALCGERGPRTAGRGHSRGAADHGTQRRLA